MTAGYKSNKELLYTHPSISFEKRLEIVRKLFSILHGRWKAIIAGNFVLAVLVLLAVTLIFDAPSNSALANIYEDTYENSGYQNEDDSNEYEYADNEPEGDYNYSGQDSGEDYNDNECAYNDDNDNDDSITCDQGQDNDENDYNNNDDPYNENDEAYSDNNDPTDSEPGACSNDYNDCACPEDDYNDDENDETCDREYDECDCEDENDENDENDDENDEDELYGPGPDYICPDTTARILEILHHLEYYNFQLANLQSQRDILLLQLESLRLDSAAECVDAYNCIHYTLIEDVLHQIGIVGEQIWDVLLRIYILETELYRLTGIPPNCLITRRFIYDVENYHDEIHDMHQWIQDIAAEIITLANLRDYTECGYEWELYNWQITELQDGFYEVTEEVEDLAERVQYFAAEQTYIFANINYQTPGVPEVPAPDSGAGDSDDDFALQENDNDDYYEYNYIEHVRNLALQAGIVMPRNEPEVPTMEMEYVQQHLTALNTGIYELEHLLTTTLALLSEVIGIMPLAAGPSAFTPPEILALGLGDEHFVEVNTNALINSALTAASTINPLVIRVTGNFNLTQAAAILTSAGPTDRVIHIYSYSAESFAITRTVNARHFFVNRSVTMHLHNVRLTQTGAPADSTRGGLAVQDSARLYMHSGSMIDNNQGVSGGGINVTGPNAVLTMNAGSTVHNNRAAAAGATVRTGGGIAVSGANARIYLNEGSTISNNSTAGGTGGGANSANGGGIHQTGGTLTIDGATINNNTGSGIHFAGSALIIHDATIRSNSRGGENDGAGIHQTAGSLTIHDVSIYNNFGVGIRYGGTTFRMYDGLINNNNNVTAGTIESGGGIRIVSGAFTMMDGTISNNSRRGSGGGMQVVGGSFTMNGGTIYRNTATLDGAGIFTNGGTITIHEGLICTNTATRRGGGFYVNTGGNVTLNAGAVVNGNNANLPSGSGNGGGGGGIQIFSGGTVRINGAAITNNRSLFGGGISVAYGLISPASNLIINGATISGNRAMSNGGGIHSNPGASITISGLVLLNDNHAGGAGGGMRVFINNTTFTFSPGSQFIGNTAVGNGGALSIGDGTGAYVNANNVGIRGNGVVFDGNIAGGNGGAIHHEGTNMAEARGMHFVNTQFTNNQATHGGAIWVARTLGNHNNLPTNAPTTRLQFCAATVFSGNVATGGLRPDEILASRNLTNIPHVGSALWYGPRTNAGNAAGTTGTLLAIEERNHVWNNYDIVVRNWLEARNVNWHPIGPAADDSTMEAELIRTNRSNNLGGAGAPFGIATIVTTTLNLPFYLVDGSTVIHNSLTAFEVLTKPWNAEVTHWVNTQTTRTFTPGNLAAEPPVHGTWSYTYTETEINNQTTTLTNINVNQHTLIQPYIDYIYHPITFVVYPSDTDNRINDGDSDEETITRTLRQSRSEEDHDDDTGAVGDRGEPIGEPPETMPDAPEWMFLHWRKGAPDGPIVDIDDFDEIYVSDELTFYAIFVPARADVSITKNVAGDMGSFTAYFTFTMELSYTGGGQHNPLSTYRTLNYSIECRLPCTTTCNCDVSTGIAVRTATLTLDDTVVFQLRHGQTITFEDVHMLLDVRVTEDYVRNYVTRIDIYADGELVEDAIMSLTTGWMDVLPQLHIYFTNTLNAAPPMGVNIGFVDAGFAVVGIIMIGVWATIKLVTKRYSENL